jgi:hypothetical protein
MFILEFDHSGLKGLTSPQENDPACLAENFAFLRRISVALQDFDEHIKAIESAYEEITATKE